MTCRAFLYMMGYGDFVWSKLWAQLGEPDWVQGNLGFVWPKILRLG
jgi:hypothetical protein